MANSDDGASLAGLLRPCADATAAALSSWLEDPAVPAELADAMRYSCLNGGKRLRPALVLLSAEAVADGDSWLGEAMPAAVAVEMVHCYSLVHDDLPAMDDDALRRGKPTTHVQFGEAMAILAGDALLTRAFEVICLGVEPRALAAGLIAELAAAAGPAGMVAGQVADMALCSVPDGDEGRRQIHMRKTGALIRAAVRMGGMCAGADQARLEALSRFGEDLGLAFQIADDVLDATAQAATIGKTPGKDAEAGKRTYARELGLDAAGQRVDELTADACRAVGPLGGRASKLQQLARLLSRRQH